MKQYALPTAAKLTLSTKQRKKQSNSGFTQDVGIIHIHATENNTILTLTDSQGNTKAWASSGTAGFRSAKKSTPYAAQHAGEVLGKKALSFSFSSFLIRMKGVGFGKEAAVRGLRSGGVVCGRIEDVTRVPHNGCRPPKKRRM